MKQNTHSKYEQKMATKPSSNNTSEGTTLSTRGRTFVGTVVSDRMTKTVTVEWPRKKYIPKYQRYEKRRTKVKAHDELGAKIGDKVEIKETKPLSKTKTFVVTRIL